MPISSASPSSPKPLNITEPGDPLAWVFDEAEYIKSRRLCGVSQRLKMVKNHAFAYIPLIFIYIVRLILIVFF